MTISELKVSNFDERSGSFFAFLEMFCLLYHIHSAFPESIGFSNLQRHICQIAEMENYFAPVTAVLEMGVDTLCEQISPCADRATSRPRGRCRVVGYFSKQINELTKKFLPNPSLEFFLCRL